MNTRRTSAQTFIRPEIAALRIEEGHWEGDTVVGKRGSKEAVVLSLLEKKTENDIAIRIPGKDADSVLNAMRSLREGFGEKFSQVFKTITVDNGSEFSAFSQVENWGCAVYFAHPYTSWERPQNERHNGLFRAFVPKGVSIEVFSAEYILAAADELTDGLARSLATAPRRSCLRVPRLCLRSRRLRQHRPGRKPAASILTDALIH